MKRLFSLSLLLLSCLCAESFVVAMKKSADDTDEIRELLAARHRAHLQRIQQESQTLAQVQLPAQTQVSGQTLPTQIQTQSAQVSDSIEQQEKTRCQEQALKYEKFLAQQEAEQKQKEELSRLMLEQKEKPAREAIESVLAIVTNLVLEETLKYMSKISDPILKTLETLLDTLRKLHENKEVSTLLEEKNTKITELMNALKQVVMELIVQVNQNTRLSVNMIADKNKIQQFEDLCNQISMIGGDKTVVKVQIEPETDNDGLLARQLHQEFLAQQSLNDFAVAQQLDRQENGGHVQPMFQPSHEQMQSDDADVRLALELSRQENERDTKLTHNFSSTSSTETDEQIARRLQDEEDAQQHQQHIQHQQGTVSAPTTTSVSTTSTTMTVTAPTSTTSSSSNARSTSSLSSLWKWFFKK